jgi:hypothetical protein
VLWQQAVSAVAAFGCCSVGEQAHDDAKAAVWLLDAWSAVRQQAKATQSNSSNSTEL